MFDASPSIPVINFPSRTLGGCEDLADPKPCSLCVLGIPVMGLPLALGGLTGQKALEQEGLHDPSKLQDFSPSTFHLTPNIPTLSISIQSFRIPLPRAFSCSNSLSSESKSSQHCGSPSLWVKTPVVLSHLSWPLDIPVALLENCSHLLYPLFWARCAQFCPS